MFTEAIPSLWNGFLFLNLFSRKGAVTVGFKAGTGKIILAWFLQIYKKRTLSAYVHF